MNPHEINVTTRCCVESECYPWRSSKITWAGVYIFHCAFSFNAFLFIFIHITFGGEFFLRNIKKQNSIAENIYHISLKQYARNKNDMFWLNPTTEFLSPVGPDISKKCSQGTSNPIEIMVLFAKQSRYYLLILKINSVVIQTFKRQIKKADILLLKNIIYLFQIKTYFIQFWGNLLHLIFSLIVQ